MHSDTYTNAYMYTQRDTCMDGCTHMIARMRFTSDCNLRDVFSKKNPGSDGPALHICTDTCTHMQNPYTHGDTDTCMDGCTHNNYDSIIILQLISVYTTSHDSFHSEG